MHCGDINLNVGTATARKKDKTMKQAIVNGRIIGPATAERGYVEWSDGVITAVGEGEYKGDAGLVTDAGGEWVSPGFIDIHTHGAGGYDFMDCTIEAYLGSAEMSARHGATTIFPTTLASTNENLFETFEVFRCALPLNTKGANMPGLHLEGPYFAYNQRGAQDPRYLRNPRPEEYDAILAASDDIRRMSLAPELDGALELGRVLRSKGILASIAHSDALFEEAVEAFHNGYTHVTHLYSCTSSVVRRNAFRYAGVVEAAYWLDDMTVEIITDGVHLPKSLLQLVYKLKGADRTVLITDSMRAAGMPEGRYVLGARDSGMEVVVEDGVAKLTDRSAFAGSVATADRCVRTMRRRAEVSVPEAVKMMTATPARVMHIDGRKGSLATGKDADILIFNDDIGIQRVVIGGETRF